MKVVIAGSNSALGSQLAYFLQKRQYALLSHSRKPQQTPLNCPHIQSEVLEFDYPTFLNRGDVIIPYIGKVGINFSKYEQAEVLLVNFAYVAYISHVGRAAGARVILPSTQRCSLVEHDHKLLQAGHFLLNQIGTLFRSGVSPDKKTLLNICTASLTQLSVLSSYNIYDISKLFSELAVEMFGMPGSGAIRIGNLFGYGVSRGVFSRVMGSAFPEEDTPNSQPELQREICPVDANFVSLMFQEAIDSNTYFSGDTQRDCFPSQSISVAELIDTIQAYALPKQRLFTRIEVNNQIFQRTPGGGAANAEMEIIPLIEEQLHTTDCYRYHTTHDAQSRRDFRLTQTMYQRLLEFSQYRADIFTLDLIHQLVEFLYGVYVTDGLAGDEKFIYHSLTLTKHLLDAHPACAHQTVIAALVHDCLEYTKITERQLSYYYGPRVTELTKLMSQNTRLKTSATSDSKNNGTFKSDTTRAEKRLLSLPVEASYLEILHALKLPVPGEESNLLIKLEHYIRLLRSADSDAILLKIIDNCVNYSLDCRSLSTKTRTLCEVLLFSRFVEDARVVVPSIQPLLDPLKPQLMQVLFRWQPHYDKYLSSMPALPHQSVGELEPA